MMPEKVFVSTRPDGTPCMHAFTWTPEEYYDNASQYHNTERLIERLEGMRRQPAKGTTLITQRGEGRNGLINEIIEELKQ